MKQAETKQCCFQSPAIALGDNSQKGKLVRCYFEPPEMQAEYPFIARDDGTIVANLEGFAIIPIDKWEKLTAKKT